MIHLYAAIVENTFRKSYLLYKYYSVQQFLKTNRPDFIPNKKQKWTAVHVFILHKMLQNSFS